MFYPIALVLEGLAVRKVTFSIEVLCGHALLAETISLAKATC